MSSLIKRVLLGTGANAYGQVITIMIQVLSIPIFLSHWDIKTYGLWLILSAVPTYLSLSDFGLVTAAGNRINILISRNESVKARVIFQSAQMFTFSICVLLAAGTSAWVFIPGGFLPDMNSRIALGMLILAIAAGQVGGLAESIFKATRGYAIATGLASTARLMEWIGYIIGLSAGGTFLSVALGGLVGRISVVALGVLWASGRHPYLNWGVKHGRLAEVRGMLVPGLSFLLFSLANAFTFQGFTLLSGIIFGPAATVIFNTYRTLARVAVQVTSMLGHALWPEFSILFGQRDYTGLSRVYKRAFLISGIGSLLLSALLFMVAQPLLQLWTNGTVPFQPLLLLTLLVYAAIAGCTHIPRIVLMSTNNHVVLGYCFALISAVSIGLGWLLGQLLGPTGLAASMALAEISTLALSVCLLHRFIRQNLSLAESIST